MNLSVKKAITWTLSLFLIIGITSSGFSDVLCISDDGQIKLESICQPCDGESTDICLMATAANSHDHQDDCDNCSDLSMGGPSRLRKNSESDSSPIQIAFKSFHSFSPCSDNNFSNYGRIVAELSFCGQDHLVLLLSTTVIIC